MKHRNLAAVFFLSILTLGIYMIVWWVKTKGGLVQRGADIPTAWLLIIPFVNIYWLFRYFKGAELVSAGKLQSGLLFGLYMAFTLTNIAARSIISDETLAFALSVFLACCAIGIIVYMQSKYNQITGVKS